MSWQLEREFEVELIEGEKDTRPEMRDLKKSRLYFCELSDALMHYASRLPPGQFATVTVRTDSEGSPIVETVLDTRFPALDDLPDHLRRLRYSARQLDRLPPVLWQELWNKRLTGSKDVPYIAMAVILSGLRNNRHTAFRRDAWIYKSLLSDLSWARSDNPDCYRDSAEQCFRTVDAHVQLNEFFAVKGFPEGIEDF